MGLSVNQESRIGQFADPANMTCLLLEHSRYMLAARSLVQLSTSPSMVSEHTGHKRFVTTRHGMMFS
jgi:hypothetical protein